MPRGANLQEWRKFIKATARAAAAAAGARAAAEGFRGAHGAAAAGGGGGGGGGGVRGGGGGVRGGGGGVRGGGRWVCPNCTLINEAGVMICAACNTPINDEGFAMTPGRNGVLYCGRNLGIAAIPGSVDGVCGPHSGGQCNSCKRFLMPAPEGTRVYAVLGHGCDITGLERQPIPAGSYYITVEECGSMSADLPKIVYAFKDPDPTVARNVRLLDGNKSFEDMISYFSLGLRAPRPFKARGPGRNHTIALNSLFAQLDLTHLGGSIIVKSGVYEIGHIPYINDIPGKIYMTFPNIDRPDVERGKIAILKRDLQEIYRGSLYEPNYDDIFGRYAGIYIKVNELNGRIATSLYRKYAHLEPFSMPRNGMYKVINNREIGIIYNLACRSPCDGDERAANRLKVMSQLNSGRAAARGANAGFPPYENVMFDYIDSWSILRGFLRRGERGGIRGGAYAPEGPPVLLLGGAQPRKNTRKDRRRRKMKRKNKTKRVRS